MPGKRKAEHDNPAPAVSPEDPGFLECLDPDLREIANTVLDDKEDTSARLEVLENKLRWSVMKRIREAAGDLGEYWTEASRLCLHIVFMAEESPDSRYKDLNARKIPFVLLEDILDCLPAQKCASFWHKYCMDAFEIIFGQRIWLPSPTQHPCWLPFLKISNKLIRRLPPKDAGSILLVMCRVFPLSERSGTRWGSHNASNVTAFESMDEFQEEQSLMPTDEEGSATDYNFYESFWKLQEDLNHPNGLHAKAVPAFLQRLKNLIMALESHTVSSHTPSHLDGTKYLTGSHLIAYQLQDPEFRIHILSQILIVCRHMSAAGPTLRTKLQEWDNRSRALLKKVGPDGSKHLVLLDSIFSRSEEAWRKWKKEKCQEDLDKALSQPLETRKKRRSLGGTLSTADDGEDEASQALTLGVMDPSELATASKQMRGLLPSLHSHLQDYVEALDPEAGIEAEYHPKNDKLFSWRALRLMSRDHLSHLPLVHTNGDFEGLVRQVYSEEQDMKIPGDFPAYEVDEFDEKEEEEAPDKDEEPPENEAAPEEAGKDEDMVVDEVSASAPEKVEPEISVDKDGASAPMEVTADSKPDTPKEKPEEKKEKKREQQNDKKPEAKPSKKPDETPTKAPAPSDTSDERSPAKFTPPPRRAMPGRKYTDFDRQPSVENGHQRSKEDPVNSTNTGGRRTRAGIGEGSTRGDQGRNQPTRSDRGQQNQRDVQGARRDGRRSPLGREDHGPSSRNERGAMASKASDRGPPSRRDEHWMPPGGGRGLDRDSRRGGRGGGHRGAPPERWDDRRRRDDRMDDRRRR